MLSACDTPLLERLAHVAGTSEGRAMLDWLAASREALRDANEGEDTDRPIEKGASRLIGELVKQIEGARAELERRRKV